MMKKECLPWIEKMRQFGEGPPLWTDKNRAKYNRDHLRYPSDLTDDEWAHVEPLIPPARRGGGKRRTNMRAVMNGVMYILSTGCQWRYIPKDFPPRSTLHDYFTWWHCHVGSDPSCTVRRMPREGGASSLSDLADH